MTRLLSSNRALGSLQVSAASDQNLLGEPVVRNIELYSRPPCILHRRLLKRFSGRLAATKGSRPCS